MAETAGHPASGDGAADGDAHGAHGIHLPPNSWAPISLALGLTALFVGFIVGWPLWVAGALWSIASIVAWVRGARTEYLHLPD